MLDIIDNTRGDAEAAHSKMDAFLCHQLRALGFGAGIEVFENAEKWYA
jgi:hypothetical protein